MDEFFLAHEVKQHFILLFDYIGKKYFSVKIYNPNRMEVDFSSLTPTKCKTDRGNLFNESEYIVGVNAVEEEKVKAMLRLNGFRRNFRYYKRSITQYDIDRTADGLVSMHYYLMFF